MAKNFNGHADLLFLCLQDDFDKTIAAKLLGEGSIWELL